jgi:hypothetical protein
LKLDVTNLLTDTIVMASCRYPETIFESPEGSYSISDREVIEGGPNITGTNTSTQTTGMERYEEEHYSRGKDKRTNNTGNIDLLVHTWQY